MKAIQKNHRPEKKPVPKKIEKKPTKNDEIWVLNTYTCKLQKVNIDKPLPVPSGKTFSTYEAGLKARLKLLSQNVKHAEKAIESYQKQKLKLMKDFLLCEEELKKIESKS